ncbi:hypothetical protein D1115_03670 [Vibrio alfacsensis]|uniref:Uncharacterized protein n=1 Tax=Vibrio alfacsensis TaxID=1074311 RepID=A0ABM6YRS0_9VIBR|nr:hypothetical protein [Vibrio alfacsensis]AXY00464.1 hypothetical protein D1115_03670 [Vibrio alfacsensis]
MTLEITVKYEIILNPRLDVEQVIEVDLSSLDGVTVTDDDGEWQLSKVMSVGATVAPVAPDNTENKAFTFSAAIDGVYDVSYVVSDHHNAHSIGVIRFNVGHGGVSPVKSWEKITATQGEVSRTYLPTPIHSEVQAMGNTSYQYEKIGTQTYQVATLSKFDATKYCNTQGGRLPTEEELTFLWQQRDAESVREKFKKIPKQVKYWSNTSLISMLDGTVEPIDEQVGYVSCIQNDQFIITALPDLSSEDAVINDEVIAGKTIPINITLSGGDVDVGNISISGHVDHGELDCPTPTNGSGQTSCDFNSTKAGSRQVRLVASQYDEGVQPEAYLNIAVTGDPEPTKLQYNEVIVKMNANQTKYDEEFANTEDTTTSLKVTVQDEHGNGVKI